MHLTNSLRVKTFQQEPRRGWQPLGTGELIPESQHYPSQAVYGGPQSVAVLNMDREHEPFLAKLAAYSAAKAKAAQALATYLSRPGTGNTGRNTLIEAEQGVTRALVSLTNEHVRAKASGTRSAPDIPLTRAAQAHQYGNGAATHEMCTVKYTCYTMPEQATAFAPPDQPAISTATQAPVAWACPLAWRSAIDFAKAPRDTRVAHCKNLYDAIRKTCPAGPATRRLHQLLNSAVTDANIFESAVEVLRLQDRPHVDRTQATVHGMSQLHATYHDPRGCDHAEHWVTAGARDVNVCANWHDPHVNSLLRHTVLRAAGQFARAGQGDDDYDTNLFNLCIKIQAPMARKNGDEETRDDDLFTHWESHVLEIMPYGGPDSCTVTRLAFSQPYSGDDCAFLSPPEGGDRSIQDQPNAVCDLDGFSPFFCQGAHRKMRYGTNDLINLFAMQPSVWTDRGHGEFAEFSPTDRQSFAYRLSFPEWDFFLASYRMLSAANTPVALTSVIAVHYPPFLTHRGKRGVVSPTVSLHNPESAPSYFIHLINAGVSGRPDWHGEHWEDEETTFMYYHRLQSVSDDDFTRALRTVQDQFTALQHAISRRFTDDWVSGASFYENVLDMGWHYNHPAGQPGADQPDSARGMWVAGWHRFLSRCILTALHAASPTTVDDPGLSPGEAEEHLLVMQCGLFAPSSHLPKDPTHALWREILSSSLGDPAVIARRSSAYEDWAHGQQTVHALAERPHARPAQAPAQHHAQPAHAPAQHHAQPHAPPAHAPAHHHAPHAHAQHFPHIPPKSGRLFVYDKNTGRVHDGDIHVRPPPPGQEHANKYFKQRARLSRQAGPTQARLSRKVVSLPVRPPPLASKLQQIEQRLERSEHSANMEHLLTRLLTRLDPA